MMQLFNIESVYLFKGVILLKTDLGYGNLVFILLNKFPIRFLFNIG